MKRAFIIIMLILCCTLSTTADTNQLSLSEALAIAEGQFEGKDVDYYVLQEDNASVWRIFVDAEPTKGWEHDCYLLTIPKTTNSGILASKTQLRMPPFGNFVPLRVKNRFGAYANERPTVKKSASLSNEATAAAQNTYAVIINGGVNRLANYERYSAQGELIDQKKFNK